MLDRRPDICSNASRSISQGLLKKHFEDCNVSPSLDMVKILGKAKFDKLLTLEALFIAEIRTTLNTKDEYKSRTLKLKFI